MIKECFKDIWLIRKILLVVLTPLVLLPLPLIDGTPKSECAYVVLIMAVFWITEALPISVTALLPVFLFPIVGLLSVKEASQQYINNKSMLFVGGFIVAAAIERWNIHRRIALRIMFLFGTDPRWLMLGIMIPTWFISMWICNTSTTALMLPIAYAILLQLKDTDKDLNKNIKREETYRVAPVDCRGNTFEETTNEVKVPVVNQNGASQVSNGDVLSGDNNSVEEEEDPRHTRMCKAFTLGVAYAAICGGIATMTGAIPNLVFIGVLEAQYAKHGLESPVTFANWMGFCVPTSLVLLLIAWIWLQILFLRSLNCCSRYDGYRSGRIKSLLREEYEKLGPVTFGQGAVTIHFLVLIILWITRDMGGEVGWGHIFKDSYVREAVPAILIASLLFVFPSKIPRVFCCRNTGVREEPQPLLHWRQAVDRVPWGIVFLLGSGFCIANAAKVSGLSKWLGTKLADLDFMEPWLLVMVLCYVVAAMTEIISNPAVCTIMMPIIFTLALGLELNPLYLMFPAALSTSFAFMLPAASPPNAIAFSYGYLKVIDMVSGLSKWIGSKLYSLEGMEPWILCLVLCYLVAAMTEIISNPAVCTLMVPLISALAIGVEINPLYLMFPAALSTSFAFMLPAAAPPNAKAFSYGYVKVRDMVFAGFLLNIGCVLVLVGSTETIGQALFDFHTTPKAFLANTTVT